MYQYDRSIKDTDNKRVWGIHGFQDFGFSGKCKLPQIKIRGFYLEVCKNIYACRLLCGFGAGVPSPCLPYAFYGIVCGLGRLDLPGIDIPRYQLPLCACNQYSIEFLCGNRRRKQGGRAGERFQLSGNPLPDKVCCF